MWHVMAARFLLTAGVTHSPLKAQLSHNHTALTLQMWKQKCILLSLLTKLSWLKYALTNFLQGFLTNQLISAFKLFLKILKY